MKVLITSEWYAPVINGVVTSVVNLEKELIKLGHEVRVLTLSNGGKSFKKDNITYITSLGVEKIYPGARVALPTINKYIEELIEWKPDIIHTQCEFSTFLMARQIAKKLNIPIVHTYHTVYEDYTHYFALNKKRGKAMVRRFTKRVLKKTECVIVPTEKVHALLVGYGVNQDIRVVPTGIDLEKYNSIFSEEDKQLLRSKLGIPKENKVMIFVGRLAKEKNLEEILQFIAKINDPKITLLIVGDGPHRQALEQYVGKIGISNNVKFTGMITPAEVPNYYRIGDVFVNASNSETQGLTYVEALANGVPALCRKDPCIKNVILDGINGWQYSSYEQFRERLNLILGNTAIHNKLSENAREGAKRDFSSAAFAHRVAQIYMKTINQYVNEVEDK